ncbi:cilia- and flagella-associated protein 95 isoform X2 [Hyperolius riggenbachi]|uniref:cilia- and flagella-associated protein 95 isoform X2 n=1 Tax=Hyperolius riggenbachi TaxID=752182 RepID=UPI0035A3B3DA
MAVYVMDSSYAGDELERKGSLYLRSNHMNFNKRTMVSGWHQNREAEPKDYDVCEAPLGKKNLCHSSYKRFGDSYTEDWRTVTQQQLSQNQLKSDYEVKDIPKKMINEDNIGVLDVKRQTGCPERGFGAVLPHHCEDHTKLYLDTTYATDYIPPHPCTTISKIPEDQDYSPAYKRCISQFTDTADYRRHGRNTWQDETGTYANSQMKKIVFKSSCPITTHL